MASERALLCRSAVVVASLSFSGWAAVLLLHLLALLLATAVAVVINVSVVCTAAVAIAVIVTVMNAPWTHAMPVIIAIDNVDMTRRPLISFCHITDGL